MARTQPELLNALRHALAATAWQGAALEPLADKGLAHWHVRLAGTGLLARIPKQSQLGLAPLANLRHQQACFERAAASGHTPRLRATLPPGAALPRGALLVEEIAGTPPVLPRDLGLLARALAALHALALPAPGARAPLDDAADPLQRLLAEVQAQALHLPAAGVAPEVRQRIERELQRLGETVARPGRPPKQLVAFDAHPGNFLVRNGLDGRGGQAGRQAVLVDLEKCRYGHAGFDLAHATLYTSTTWDAQTSFVPSPSEVAAFHHAWEAAVGHELAAAARPWHVPLRRAMWLWSVTWCCKWRALERARPRDAAEGEDWSADHSDAALVAHVRERVAHYLGLPVIARVQEELRSLEGLLA